MVLHNFGQWMYRKLNKQDLVALKTVHLELKDLDSVLLGRTRAILDRVFVTDTFLDKAVWDKNGEKWMKGMDRKVDLQYDQISRQAVRLERNTFFDVARRSAAYFRHLYQGKGYVKESVVEAVIPEGLKIIGPSGFKDFVRTSVSGLPQSHLDGLEMIINKAYRRRSAYFPNRRVILLAPDQRIKSTLIHEIGHHVSHRFPASGSSSGKIQTMYTNKCNETLRKVNQVLKKGGWTPVETVEKLQVRWRSLERRAGLHIPSAYSIKNASEYYAECYKTYMTNPAKLKAIDPTVYEHLKKTVFKGKEYLAIPPKTSLAIGRGKVTEEFRKFLASQFAAGTSPTTMIKTISLEHQALVRNSLVSGIEQGAHLGMVKADVMKSIGADLVGPERKKLENNTMRILRTSHQRAANHSLNYFAEQNTNVIKGLVRTADGRPCLACAFLDGTYAPVGSDLADHPSGMCIWVYDVKTPAEMGFTEKAPGSGAAWKAEERPYPDMATKFYAMSPEEQRKMFANDSLYNLWKKEGFSPEHLITYRDGMPVPMTYQAALTKYKKWPKVEAGKPVVP